MCFVYVVRHGTTLGIRGGLLVMRYPDGEESVVPKNTVEGISIFANAVLTTQCIEFCLNNNTKVGFFSRCGVYKGALSPVLNVNTERLRKQMLLTDEETFCLKIAKQIVPAKIKNQITILRRYSGNNEMIRARIDKLLRIANWKVKHAENLNQIIGYEGIASRHYFELLSSVIETDFRFEKRNRRPTKDPFNSMLNIGYSLLTKEIYGELDNRSLNPYFGFIHKEKRGHPALASDMIEEWRPVIVDSTVLSLVQGHEIEREEFELDDQGYRMSDDALRKLLNKLEQKMETPMRYLKHIERPLTFREAIWHQAERMSKTIDRVDACYYVPILIR